MGPGSRIAGYLIEAQIGAGGMAVVYRARDEALGRLAALKVLAPALAADQEFRSRFIRESRMVAGVDDPHVIPVYGAGEAGGVLYIATRFIAGGDLAAVLRRNGGPLAPERAADIIAQVASALDAAHEIGLVHRDVKPGNVLIDTARGKTEHAYLSDFGLTRGTSSTTGLTSTGEFLGTPAYCSPEQIRGRKVDGRCDQYALACVAFALLTGAPPFHREEAVGTLFAHLNDPIPPATELRPGLPSAVDAVLARGLAKAPEDRFGSCGQFAAAYRQALTAPSQPTVIAPAPVIPGFRVADPASPQVSTTPPSTGYPDTVPPAAAAAGGVAAGNVPPAAGYGAPPLAYGAGAPAYGAPAAGFGPPAGYGAPAAGYSPPASGYGAAAPAYGQAPAGPGLPPVPPRGRRKTALIAGTVAAVLAAAGVGTALALPGSSSSTGSVGTFSPSGQAGTPSGQAGLNPGTGAARIGGTLNMSGLGDVEYMDYDIGYLSQDYTTLRLTVRQLYSWPATPGRETTPAPDLATGDPVVSPDGKTVSVTIRGGVKWDTSPPRDVTAADVVRGIKRACNPSPQAFGGMADFETTIAGLSAFCTGYPANAASDAAALKAYVESRNVAGITTSGNTITFQLTRQAAWLESAMTLPPFSAVPIEAENGLPGTAAVYNHMYSDGPYQISKYIPGKTLDFVRNPVWQASTDPLRKAYVDAINVDEAGAPDTVFAQIRANSPSLGMAWGVSSPPAADIQDLLNQVKQGSHDITVIPTYSSNPYLSFNTISPNQGHALGKVTVRQALEYGINRSQLIQAYGGPAVNPPLTHVLPPGTGGAEDLPANYDPYPYNPDKARSLLASAGFTANSKLTLKLLYRTDNQKSVKGFQDIQQQLSSLGVVNVVGKPVSAGDFYTKYLYDLTSPTPTSQGAWDLALTGWIPDWYGDSALTWFNPMLASPGGFPVNGGSNFGYFSSPAVNADIAQALAQRSDAEADKFWAKADQDAMAAAAFYPVSDPLQIAVHADYVHNAVYLPQCQQFDPANVWLSTPGG
jgi:peptide/nickel transport system substrate-binding protein